MYAPSRPLFRGSQSALSILLALAGGALLISTLSMSAKAHVPLAAEASTAGTARVLTPVSIDYPENESIFPPGITPPAFLWRDAAGTSWNIDLNFADTSAPIHLVTKAERMQLGAIDPATSSSSNSPPKLTPQQAASWTWKPDTKTWAAIQAHSVASPATLTITGIHDGLAVSQSRITFTTSKDEVGAPIFYRDVPLMPSTGVAGAVSPLAQDNIHLIHWRIRDIRKPESHTVLKDMPTCANCHSFSADGKTFGMDIDGPANDKGLYAVVPVQKHIVIGARDLVNWNTDGTVGTVRVGFMSQLSPNGQYVLTTFAGPPLNRLIDAYYVTNFMDYRFLQVFYPTRGVLQYFNRATGIRQLLPGADNPKFVQTDGVWSPDGRYIVFARAEARDPRPPGQGPATHANDPHEAQIKYDLYRVPFNGGKGGTPEPIKGASHNGMSNNFPKISPDGKWIVFVQCRNGQLMRPDSQLYIVPATGGTPRRLRANTRLMNSWHSWSPNSRWLVFSSKARSPYTQMYLTHIDENGNSSPAILIDNTTASNRAVNIPEFVNISPDGIDQIEVHVADGTESTGKGK